MDFAVPADNRVKIKESKDKYLDLAEGRRKLWNMRVTVIPFVNGKLETVSKGLERELEDLDIGGSAKTIQTTALLRSARNIEKDPGDWRRLVINQTPMKCHHLKHV